MRKALRAVAATACVGLMLAGAGGTAVADEPEAKAGKQVYLVHGYGYDEKDADGKPMKGNGKDCNRVWGNAEKYFEKHHLDGNLKKVGYYSGDINCGTTLGDGKATTDTRIRTLAAELAKKIHKDNEDGKRVDVVAHSMGGLITRVALLGSAKDWEGFPKADLKVDDVVTLGTPHNGVRCEDDKGDGKDKCPDNAQWRSMDPDSHFMDVLHRKKNSLGEWGKATDWSFVGAKEDETVSGSSAIDKGRDANHKYWYDSGGDHKLGHSQLRSFYKGNYNLKYWHSKEDKQHSTDNGWAPLEIAFHALDKNDKW